MTITPEMSVEQVAEQAVTWDCSINDFFYIYLNSTRVRGVIYCKEYFNQELDAYRKALADILRADRAAREKHLRGLLDEAGRLIHQLCRCSDCKAQKARIDAVLKEVTP